MKAITEKKLVVRDGIEEADGDDAIEGGDSDLGDGESSPYSSGKNRAIGDVEAGKEHSSGDAISSDGDSANDHSAIGPVEEDDSNSVGAGDTGSDTSRSGPAGLADEGLKESARHLYPLSKASLANSAILPTPIYQKLQR